MLYIGKKYFEGYEEKFVPKKHGAGYKKVRVYCGDIYRIEGSAAWQTGRKLLFAALAVLFFAVFFWGGHLRTRSNASALVVLPYAAGLIAGGYYLIGVVNLLLAKPSLTVFKFREIHQQLLWGSAAAACGTAAAALGGAVLIALWHWRGGTAPLQGEWLTLGSNALCALAMLAAHVLERRVRYTVCPGRSSADE